MTDNACDNCGVEAELYHNEATGLAYCDECETQATAEPEGTFHAELRQIIEAAPGTGLELLIPQAEALLALPEESVAAMVEAAQSMLTAVSAAR